MEPRSSARPADATAAAVVLPPVGKSVIMEGSLQNEFNILTASKWHVQAPALLDVYVRDARIDSEESLHKLQYLLIMVENLLPEAGAAEKSAAEKLAAGGLVTVREAAMRRQLAPLRESVQLKKGNGPALGLLRCIKTIVGRAANFRVQEQLQRLVLMYHGSANAKDFGDCLLPPGMRSPRSAVHVQDRLRHFEVLRREVDIVHYMHDSEVPKEIRMTGEESQAGSSPPARLALMQELRRTCDPKSVLPAQGPKPAVARQQPSSRPQSSSSKRRPSCSCLSELARKTKLLMGDLEVRDESLKEAPVNDPTAEALARVLLGPTLAGAGARPTVAALPAPLLTSGASTPPSRARSNPRAPPLTGITSGFMQAQSEDCPKEEMRLLVQYPRQASKLSLVSTAVSKQAASSCPSLPSARATEPRASRPATPAWGVFSRRQRPTTCEPTDQPYHRVTDKELRDASAKMRGADKDSRKSSRMSPLELAGQRRSKRLSGSTAPGGGNLGSASKTSVHSRKLSLTSERKLLNSAPTPSVRGGSLSPHKSSIALEPASAVRSEMPSKTASLKALASAARHVGRGAKLADAESRFSSKGRPSSLEGQVEGLVSRFLQERGLEKKTQAMEMDLELEDLRAEAAAAARDEATRVRNRRAGSAPQLPGAVEAGPAEAEPRRNSFKGKTLEEAFIIPGKPKGVMDVPSKRLTAEGSWTAEVGYLRGCMQSKVFPRLIKIFVDESPKLDLDSQYLVDGELDAVLRALQAPSHANQENCFRDQPITDLSLANNPSLTDFTVARFMSTVIDSMNGQACIGPLKRVSLAFCTGIGEVAISALADLLGRGTDLVQLEELDLCNVAVPPASWPLLTAGLGCARFMRRLLIAHTGCGRQSQASCVAISELVGSRSLARLEALDLGGNHFLDEGCRALGAALRTSPDTLLELDLSHNAGLNPIMFVKDEESNPITHVLEALGETTLTKAAFVNCQLAYKEDCVLEASVTSSDIIQLDVSDNPHGEAGLRCLVRLLACPAGQRLQQLTLDSVRLHPTSGLLTYEYTNPSAPYRLYFENVQHRSILRLLLKRSEEATGNSRCTCFRQEHFNGKSLADEGGTPGLLQICSKRQDRGGDDWLVPEKGTLTFFFQMPSIYDDGEKIDQVYHKFQRRNKICVNFQSFAKLLQVFKGLVDKQSKHLLLEAMSKDLCLKFCQVKHLGLVSQDLLPFVLRSLLPETTQLPLRSTLFDLVVCCSKSWPEALPLKIAGDCRNLVFFNFTHPDGHYELSLEIPADRATAQRCIVASRWVKAYCQARELLDISEHGDLECMWHVVHGSQQVWSAATEWQLPERGKLVFDFVLPRIRFGKQGPPEDSSTLKALGEAMTSSPCKYGDRLHALRMIAHQLVLRPEQLQEAIEWYPDWCPKFAARAYTDLNVVPVQPRAEAYATLYNRTLDHSVVVSPKILYNPSLLHEEEMISIRKRLGMMHTFDVVNLHDPRSNLGTRHGPMDLVTWDGFTILKAMVAITKDEVSVNFDDGYWSEQVAFYERGFAFILPASWFPDPPRAGSFTVTFTSKDDEVNHVLRRQVAQRLLGWTFPEAKEA